MQTTLPVDSSQRKDIPLYSGCRMYFPAALAGVAMHSKMGNDKHNPGQPLHHARGKSMDHADCIDRHMTDIADIEAAFQRTPELKTPENVAVLLAEANALSWRALALSQRLHEEYGGAPLAPAAKLPDTPPRAPDLMDYDTVEGRLAAIAALPSAERVAPPLVPFQGFPPHTIIRPDSGVWCGLDVADGPDVTVVVPTGTGHPVT